MAALKKIRTVPICFIVQFSTNRVASRSPSCQLTVNYLKFGCYIFFLTGRALTRLYMDVCVHVTIELIELLLILKMERYESPASPLVNKGFNHVSYYLCIKPLQM